MRSFSLACYFVVAVALLGCSAVESLACSVFCVVRAGKVLFCNNEDYIKPGFIWFVPAAEGRFGRVNLGFEDQFAKGA